jgi:hypothetical protein
MFFRLAIDLKLISILYPVARGKFIDLLKLQEFSIPGMSGCIVSK